LDIVFSLIAIAVLGLPMLAVAFLVRVKLGSPVIFKQRRIGRGNREFLLLKFRTMTEERDENGVYLPDADRLTPFGKFLRRTSIDELPSLINIIRGEMSIIGPRPLPVRYLPRYTKEELRRHTVRPGLSNVSVINGRNSQSWKDQFETDVWYVDHMNFRLDVKSVIDTVKIVITKEGATSADGDSRCEFIGTADAADLSDDDCNYIKIQQ
jgi:lipopolysaccharide/colanic/teichoic acid biosynthesis glycosyltransferase